MYIELVNIIHNYLISIDNIHLTAFLAHWPSSPLKIRSVYPNTLPVLSYLPKLTAEANTNTEKIVEIIKAKAELFNWGQTYSKDDFDDAFLGKYGWTELIGLRGPIISENIACGFLLLGADIEYPKHSHESEEVYIPLNSQTQWIQGDGDWTLKPGGVPIYHKPWQPHGMRTKSTPLLALYLWHGGNLAQKSHIN